MGKQYWLVKQEPDSYAFATFVKDGTTRWDGVRNYQARNNLKAMKAGDPVLFYSSGDDKAVVGLASVEREAFPDPTADDASEGWVAVELRAGKALPRPVPLAEIKAEKSLSEILLVRHSRLSVMPLEKAAYEKIVAMAKG